MATVRELLLLAEQLPTDSPRRDAEILLGECLDKPRSWLYTWPEAEVAETSAERYRQLLHQRMQGRPVAHLTGRRQFWNLNLGVNEHTLIPRPETETLVQWALELDLPDSAAVLDLGTGSGAIALALASQRNTWRLVAVDNSQQALQKARDNGRRIGCDNVEFLYSDWFQAIGGRCFDCLVGNPPYIDAQDPHLLQGDVRFEARSALVAADGGLADLEELVSRSSEFLNPGGWLLLEHGFDQAAAVRQFLEQVGYCGVTTRVDLAGQPRISGGQKHA